MKRIIASLTVLFFTVPAFATLTVTSQNSGSFESGGYNASVVDSPASGSVMLHEVPTSRWTYGCSATAAGMMFGYYDRHGYDNMYTGPANGGLAPLYDLGAQTSLIATKKGFDGRTTRGHVDDYWISSGTDGPDPWQGNWTEHTWGRCTADFMGTNQAKWDFDGDGFNEYNSDGATALWTLNSGQRLYDYIPASRYGSPSTGLTHGLRLFAESRGYTVLQNYTQKIDTLYSDGFSFADYMNEIDNGYPVMIQVRGHSMLGVGYEQSSETVYLHDTWGNYVADMTWGGYYSGMQHFAVTVLHMAGDITYVPEPASLICFAIIAVPVLTKRKL